MISTTIIMLSMAFNPNHTVYHNNTYQGMVQQFNSSICNRSFYNFSYEFTCSEKFNRTECCYHEYMNLNTSFGNSQCSQYDRNDTYINFDCHLSSNNSSSKSWFDNKTYVYIGAAVISFILLCIMYRCCCSSRRRNYNRV
jgi:hypothetical protein